MMNIPGCDMSVYQAGRSMPKLKKQFSFAILRCGFTSINASRNRNKDAQFESFYKESRELELPVGAYYYSCANTFEEGVDDALFVLSILDGRKLEYPVYIDVEDNTWQSDRKKGVTDAIIGFCETMLAAGYFPGVYSSTWWYDNWIDTPRLEIWSKWVACWCNSKPSFKYSHFDIWQNSESGYVGKYQIDTDFCYTDLPQTIREMGLNGYGVWGDVNGNGKLDAQDYAMVKRYVLGTFKLTEKQKERADVDGDGKVTSKDYAMIKRAYLGTYEIGGKK
jgi:hypothetical protein